MIDTHCHLDFCDDPVKAADSTLDAIVTVGTTLARSQRAVELARDLPNVYAVVGVHPNDAPLAREASVREGIALLAGLDLVVGVGETGFDTYWERASLEDQRQSFFWQARLAIEVGKPLILHVRDKQGEDVAAKEAARSIAKAGTSRGILHCFGGDSALLEVALDLGWHVSFAGNLTYPKAHKLHEAASNVPERRLLVETDAPFLAPAPVRGKPNQPAYVAHTLAFLAELRGVSKQEMEQVTDANARAVYNFM